MLQGLRSHEGPAQVQQARCNNPAGPVVMHACMLQRCTVVRGPAFFVFVLYSYRLTLSWIVLRPILSLQPYAQALLTLKLHP